MLVAIKTSLPSSEDFTKSRKVLRREDGKVFSANLKSSKWLSIVTFSTILLTEKLFSALIITLADT